MPPPHKRPMFIIIAIVVWLILGVGSVNLLMKKKPMRAQSPTNMTHEQLFGWQGGRASDRAAQLLWDHMNSEQRQSAISSQNFTVTRGRVTIMFSFTDPHRVMYKISGHNYWMSMCINVVKGVGHLPYGDIILNKKVTFEADPD